MSEFSSLQPGEIRIIKIGHAGTVELIWEALMEYGNNCFKLSDNDEETVFVMKYNKTTRNTTFVACKLNDHNKVDIDVIDQSVDITANSMFDASPYVVKYLDDTGVGTGCHEPEANQ